MPKQDLDGPSLEGCEEIKLSVGVEIVGRENIRPSGNRRPLSERPVSIADQDRQRSRARAAAGNVGDSVAGEITDDQSLAVRPSGRVLRRRPERAVASTAQDDDAGVIGRKNKILIP